MDKRELWIIGGSLEILGMFDALDAEVAFQLGDSILVRFGGFVDADGCQDCRRRNVF